MAVIAFYVFASLLLLSATTVILARNPVHAVLFLILGFFNAAGLFILLGAEFIAMILVIVYVGAVAVLFLFVVMMLNIKPQLHNLWFKGDQLSQLKQAGRDVVLYLLCWLLVMVVFGCAASWLARACLNQNVTALYQNYSSIINAPSTNNMTKAVLIFITAAGVLLASYMTARCTRIKISKTLNQFFQSLPIPVFISGILVLELMVTLWYWAADAHPVTPIIYTSASITNTHALAPLIYQDFMLIFLISGLILLVAMIGAIILTLREHPDNKRQDIGRQLARRKSETLEICKVNVGEGIR